MKSSPRILILTASYGDGHLQAASALKKMFQHHRTDDVRIMDLMAEAHPIINKVTRTLYIKSMLSSRFGFDYYGWIYYMTRDTKPYSRWSRYVDMLGKKKLKETIEHMRPDAVISTFPFGAAPELCSGFGIPCFCVVTDFSLHSRWIQPRVDKYYVATEELKKQLALTGYPEERVTVSGIPVGEAFERHVPLQSNPFGYLRDDGRKTILVLAGSYGVLGGMDDLLHSLLKIRGYRIAVVCGRNQKLEHRLRAKFSHETDVHIFGFIHNIYHLLAVSSCIVTKAGGLTLSESIAMKTPIFIFKPFAGQEKENALYLLGKGAAAVSGDAEQLASQIETFLADPRNEEEAKRRLAALHKKNAADVIAGDILQAVHAAGRVPAAIK